MGFNFRLEKDYKVEERPESQLKKKKRNLEAWSGLLRGPKAQRLFEMLTTKSQMVIFQKSK